MLPIVYWSSLKIVYLPILYWQRLNNRVPAKTANCVLAKAEKSCTCLVYLVVRSAVTATNYVADKPVHRIHTKVAKLVPAKADNYE